MKIREFVNAYEKPRPLLQQDLEQMNEQDAREFCIASELGEMQDKQQAFRLLSEFHKAHHMPAPEKLMAQRQKEREENQQLRGEEPRENDLSLSGPK